MSLPEFPPHSSKDEQENDSDEEAERPVSSAIDEESPRRTGDADSPSGGDDNENEWNHIPNQGIEATQVFPNRLEVGYPDEHDHDTERRDGQCERFDRLVDQV